MNAAHVTVRPDWLAAIRRYLVAAVAGHLAWEVAQLPLYTLWHTASPRLIAWAVLHCTAGDLAIAAVALTLALATVGTADCDRLEGAQRNRRGITGQDVGQAVQRGQSCPAQRGQGPIRQPPPGNRLLPQVLKEQHERGAAESGEEDDAPHDSQHSWQGALLLIAFPLLRNLEIHSIARHFIALHMDFGADVSGVRSRSRRRLLLLPDEAVIGARRACVGRGIHQLPLPQVEFFLVAQILFRERLRLFAR